MRLPADVVLRLFLAVMAPVLAVMAPVLALILGAGLWGLLRLIRRFRPA